jgi:hypothetical protein
MYCVGHNTSRGPCLNFRTVLFIPVSVTLGREMDISNNFYGTAFLQQAYSLDYVSMTLFLFGVVVSGNSNNM